MNHVRFTADGALSLSTATAGKLPSQFEGVAYSGAVIPRLALVIDLDSTEVGDRLPLLSEHDRQAVCGVVTSTVKRAGRLDVAGKLFSDIPGSQAEKLAMLSQRGAPLQMSVGLFSFTEEAIPVGRTVTVNSRTVPGPVTVLRNGQVRECSIVTLGADAATTARLFSDAGATAARVDAALALFSEIGVMPTASQAATIATLSDSAFRSFAATLRQMATKQKALGQLDVTAIYARLNK